MKVTLLTASISRRAGGMLEALRGLARGLQESSAVEVSVFGLSDADTSGDLAAWNGTRVGAAPVKGPSWFGFSPELTKMLLSSGSDLVHVHGLWMYPSVACLKWARQTRRPYLVAAHGMLDPWALRNSGWKKRLAGWAYQNAHLKGAACLQALCESEARAMRAFGLRNPVCIIPNGVDPAPAPDGFRAAWEETLPEDAKVLLYLGRLHPKKNLSNLVRAWRLARDASGALRADWHLVLAGWDQGGYARQLRALALEQGVHRSVHLVGPQYGRAKHASFRRASTFVLPSLSEGLPMTVLEAWSHGLPVLMSPACNLPEGFQAGAGLPLGPSAPEMARALAQWFSVSAEERAAVGERGRQLVRRRHDWGVIAARIVAVYDWVLGGPVPSEVEMFQ